MSPIKLFLGLWILLPAYQGESIVYLCVSEYLAEGTAAPMLMIRPRPRSSIAGSADLLLTTAERRFIE